MNLNRKNIQGSTFLIMLFCFIFFNLSLYGKIRILTFHYNEPYFIELQVKCLRKFILDDFELIVFNDALTQENEVNIRNTCNGLGIQCVRFLPEWHLKNPLNQKILSWVNDPAICSLHTEFVSNRHLSLQKIAKHASVRHCHVIEYAMENYGYTHDDIVVLMDGDAFFVRDINLREELRKYDVFGLAKPFPKGVTYQGVTYPWVVFTAFNPVNLPNLKDLCFDIGVINNFIHDTGSQSYHYFENNLGVNLKLNPVEFSQSFCNKSRKELVTLGFDKNQIWLLGNLPAHHCVQFGMDKRILHFGAISFQFGDYKDKVKYVADYIRLVLN